MPGPILLEPRPDDVTAEATGSAAGREADVRRALPPIMLSATPRWPSQPVTDLTSVAE
ncbi:hypothetical protein GCM10022214_34160 [Actinomadura miaoliensis]|uniref:Uncharacterized protein n=1 Tax=Actinomadura miaoliensis TaxID=430685 RepID=A0ABP7VU73_9ACTN